MSSSQATAERRTYRGRTLEEIAGRIRSELGDDAVITRQREGLVGGIGGFFQRPFIEVEAQPGPVGSSDAPAAASDTEVAVEVPAAPEPTRGRLIDTYDNGDELPEFVPDMPFDPAELAADGASAAGSKGMSGTNSGSSSPLS